MEYGLRWTITSIKFRPTENDLLDGAVDYLRY